MAMIWIFVGKYEKSQNMGMRISIHKNGKSYVHPNDSFNTEYYIKELYIY